MHSPISKTQGIWWSGHTIGPGGPSGPGDPGRPCSPCKTVQFPQNNHSWQQCSQLGLFWLFTHPHLVPVPGNICPDFSQMVKAIKHQGFMFLSCSNLYWKRDFGGHGNSHPWRAGKQTQDSNKTCWEMIFTVILFPLNMFHLLSGISA